MKILLVGCVREAAAMLKDLLHDGRHEITHCPGGDQALTALSQTGGNFDWTIVNGRVMAEGKKELSRVLRTIRSRPVTDRDADPGPYDRIASPVVSCGVEWTRGGVLQLRCALHSQLRAAPRATAQHRGYLPGDLVFEYHAPCGKERKNDD